MVSRLTRRLLLGGYVAVMLAALLLPVPRAPDYVPGDFDKLAHIGLFAGLALLAAWNARGGRGRRVLVALGAAILLGALTEALQGVLPYRTGDPLDMVADLAGGLTGGLLGSLMPAD